MPNPPVPPIPDLPTPPIPTLPRPSEPAWKCECGKAYVLSIEVRWQRTPELDNEDV